jgi:hypothetical protein
MAQPVTLLDDLRSRSDIDCDTLDVEGKPTWIFWCIIRTYMFEVAQALGPFVDCTSNQVGSEI